MVLDGFLRSVLGPMAGKRLGQVGPRDTAPGGVRMPRRQFLGDPCRHEAATIEKRTERSRPQTAPSEITREKEQIKPKVKGRKKDH